MIDRFDITNYNRMSLLSSPDYGIDGSRFPVEDPRSQRFRNHIFARKIQKKVGEIGDNYISHASKMRKNIIENIAKNCTCRRVLNI